MVLLSYSVHTDANYGALNMHFRYSLLVLFDLKEPADEDHQTPLATYSDTFSPYPNCRLSLQRFKGLMSTAKNLGLEDKKSSKFKGNELYELSDETPGQALKKLSNSLAIDELRTVSTSLSLL